MRQHGRVSVRYDVGTNRNYVDNQQDECNPNDLHPLLQFETNNRASTDNAHSVSSIVKEIPNGARQDLCGPARNFAIHLLLVPKIPCDVNDFSIFIAVSTVGVSIAYLIGHLRLAAGLVSRVFVCFARFGHTSSKASCPTIIVYATPTHSKQMYLCMDFRIGVRCCWTG